MDFTILAIDDSTRQLHLDQPVEVLTGCAGFVNNMQVEVETVDGDVLGLHELPPQLEPGDLLQCVTFQKLSKSTKR